MRETLAKRIGSLKSRMSAREYELASDLIITMASGHWSTFDSIVATLVGDEKERALLLPGGFLQRTSSKWLSTVYYEHVRDVVVQSYDFSANKFDVSVVPKIYKALVMLAIFDVPVDPFTDALSFENNRNELGMLQRSEIVTFNDLAYVRLVQNKIGTTEKSNTFKFEVPRLSLLDVRQWCLETKGDFSETIRDVLYSAGHDPITEPKEERCPLGIAFERTSAAFIHAMFFAWKELSSAKTFGVQIDETLRLQEFLKGYRFRINSGNNSFQMKVPESTPRRLYIEGKGGFRSKGEQLPPVQSHSESEEQFKVRKSKWYQEALKELTFASYSSCHELFNGDIICPGAKNQPHSDAIYVVEWVGRDGRAVPGLIFDQMKYSEGNSSTRVESAHITTGLNNLVKERGLLYDVDGFNQFGNQISALNVKEENVLYCWSVLRETSESLEGPVREAVQELDFKGSVLITDPRDKMFGQTFQDLALLHRNRNMLGSMV